MSYPADLRLANPASMRPPEFTGGNSRSRGWGRASRAASMRPPEFTGGNARIPRESGQRNLGFNEAAGIHRRKPGACGRLATVCAVCFNEAAGIHRRRQSYSGRPLVLHFAVASMRPPEFTGGNPRVSALTCGSRISFNEAAGIHRRKPGRWRQHLEVTVNASMRPPEFTGGNRFGRWRMETA